jgi:hypothetical protein
MELERGVDAGYERERGLVRMRVTMQIADEPHGHLRIERADSNRPVVRAGAVGTEQ